MVIASRTPEGIPNRCPVCGNDLKIDPSRPTLDAPCPHCGHLLWFGAAQPLKRLTKRERSILRQKLMIECLLNLVTVRFGPIEPATRAAIEAITDSARLEVLFKRATTCSRLDELIASL
jgi:hypothetical protein